MLGFNINEAKPNGIQNGWIKFIADTNAYAQFKSALENIYVNRVNLVSKTGFSMDRELAGLFTWNVIEPQKGTFNWEMPDLAIKYAQKSNVKLSAVILPAAAWDQSGTKLSGNCQSVDFAYTDFRVGSPNDLTEYENFLTQIAKRYKGKVAVWEIGNEPDAPCGGFQTNPQAYFDLLKVSSETIKKADPTAKVVNGGASGHSDNNEEISFWTKFFELGGDKYIDYFNLHYNNERSQDAKLDPTTFQRVLTFFNDLMDKNGGKKPLYLTEFGIYFGTPSDQPVGQSPQAQPNQPGKPGQAPTNLSNLSEDAQATIYFKDSTIAFANNVNTIFIDLIGSDNNLIGSSMAFNTDNQPRLFLTTLKTIASKIDGFSKVEKIAEGQYKFTVNGKTIYALWSGTLPNEISGKVKVTNIKGQEQTMDAAGVKLSSDQPVLVE